MAQIVVVDDERSMREILQTLLEREGHAVTTAADVKSGLETAKAVQPDLVFTDLKLPDGSGMEVLKGVREALPETQVIIMTAFATTENAVSAMRLGAYDYQIKPFKMDEIRVLTQKALEKRDLIRENRELIGQLKGRYGFTNIVGRSPRMTELVAMIEKVAKSRANVLIEGESGTGKELVARAIHDASPRASGPFIAVNCGAIPETLIEAELFGHVAGAFTGATKARAGLFETAHGGTLLLDEIGELPQPMQVKLLRVIQERLVRRVGEEKEREVDVRIVAATNRDLQQMAQQGKFREDLFYRLNVVRIRVPPLRERADDIPLLARTFLARFAKDLGKTLEGFSDSAMNAIKAFPFPGNVRELENVVERAVALAGGAVIDLSDLPDEVRKSASAAPTSAMTLPEQGFNLEATLDALERSLIQQALEKSGGVKTKAADLLGLTFRSLRYRLKKLGMNGGEGEGDDEEA